MTLLYVGIFGLLGVFSRYFIGIIFKKIFNTSFPYDTFIINILGAFLIGIVYVLVYNIFILLFGRNKNV